MVGKWPVLSNHEASMGGSGYMRIRLGTEIANYLIQHQPAQELEMSWLCSEKPNRNSVMSTRATQLPNSGILYPLLKRIAFPNWTQLVISHLQGAKIRSKISKSPEIGHRFELIAISMGCVYFKDSDQNLGRLPEWYLNDFPEDLTYYEFFNVLWIVWDGVVATRRGIGRVSKSAWQRLPKECLDITLG
ncbi:hypothetical protein K432DRAFT_467637 [Lepidopterella palustris CBS 459.81]|uniref:Uncharacterized protein n=1 Tax=Lepidopterella palustris CBS 459.81 TaxID=1314670 RepID=A0A8E2E0I8_9PEZI|nr:hypothetical protein K432DRAFT_467637 [Lepidopterella palustris CBS 459.81]